MSPLTPGSVARIYRDGTLVAPAVDIPADGRFELRNLQPGQYELRDETGGSALIEVTHATEVVRVGDRGSEEGPVAAADSTRQLDRPADLPAPEPVFPVAQAPADIEEPDGEWRASLAAGEELEDAGAPGEQPPGAAKDMTVAELRDALRARGEKVSGSKEELVARVEGRDGAAA